MPFVLLDRREDTAAAEGVAEEIKITSARARIVEAVGPVNGENFGLARGDSGIALHGCHQRFKPARRSDRIVVEENEVLSHRGAYAEIAATGEAEILPGGNDAQPSAAFLRRGQAAIIATVVYDDDLMRKGGMFAQGAQAAQQNLPAAPVWDNNGDQYGKVDE